jgi:hypothetical protein
MKRASGIERALQVFCRLLALQVPSERFYARGTSVRGRVGNEGRLDHHPKSEHLADIAQSQRPDQISLARKDDDPILLHEQSKGFTNRRLRDAVLNCQIVLEDDVAGSPLDLDDVLPNARVDLVGQGDGALADGDRGTRVYRFPPLHVQPFVMYQQNIKRDRTSRSMSKQLKYICDVPKLASSKGAS